MSSPFNITKYNAISSIPTRLLEFTMNDLEEKKRKTTEKFASVLLNEATLLQQESPDEPIPSLITQTASWIKAGSKLDEATQEDLLNTTLSLFKSTSMPQAIEEDDESLWEEEELGEEDESAFEEILKKADFYRETAPVGRPGSFSTGSTPAFNSGDKPKGTLDGGVPSAYNPMNRARNPDHEEAYGRKRTPGRMPSYEVTDNPGSAKVIPDNKGFANNSSALRQASSFVEQNRQLMEAAKVKSEKKERQMKIARLVQQIMKDFEEVLSLLDD